MIYIPQNVLFDLDLIQKYDAPAPRYTSYPPITELKNDFTEFDYKFAIAASNQRQSPLSLYFHLPFCQSACYFCGCNVVVSQNQTLVETYLNYLNQEIERTSDLIDSKRQVMQIHWGGGTPNYLSFEQVESLWESIHCYFHVHEKADISIEINPRYVDKNYILFLRSLGFNRISFGIQDFNPIVQEAVNRVQPEKMLFEVMDWIKEAGFHSVNVDLIYGLPYQTVYTFQETIKKTIQLEPDRISVFNFSYIPWLKPIQKNIDYSALPSVEEKLFILQMTIHELINSEYTFLGMNHFVKPNDSLAIAQRQRTLRHNCQGYTTQANTDLFGFGATSISMLEDTYTQNEERLKNYCQSFDHGFLPVNKGFKLSRADILRRDVIMQLICNFQVEKSEIERRYQIRFDDYFYLELEALKSLQEDGLVKLSSKLIFITPLGRLLVRNIATVFDAWTKQNETYKLYQAI